jgi:ribose transport system permease protein
MMKDGWHERAKRANQWIQANTSAINERSAGMSVDSARGTGPVSAGEPREVRSKQRVLPPPVTGQELVLIGVLAVLWVILAFATPAFLTASSIQPLLGTVAPIALIGIGMTVVIITGGIDVSVGAAIMVCSVITAKVMLVDVGAGFAVTVLVAILVGGLLGLVNGLLIAYGRVHAIIITFGTANIFQWIGLQIFASSTVNGIPGTLDSLGNGAAGRTFGLPHSFVITIVLAAIAWFYLRHTAGGRHFFAIGGDPLAARLAGVRVQRRVLMAYLLTGLLVGLASCFVVAQGANLGQNVGSGKELAVIAAVVIGGTSIMGGRGSVLGTILGALLVQTVASGVTQLGWRSELSDLFVGIAIIVAVGADLLRERARRNK